MSEIRTESVNNNETLERLLKKQLLWNRITCGICVILAAALLFLMIGGTILGKQVSNAVAEAEKVVTEIGGVVEQLEGIDRILENVSKTSEDLAQTDIPGLAQEVETLIQSSQGILEDTGAKLQSMDIDTLNAAIAELQTMDIETLNKAIAELESIIAPLARLFGK